MNQLDELIRSTLDERAEDAPAATPVVSRVLAHQRGRRRRRTGWVTAGAVATATAGVVAVGVTQFGGDDGGEGGGMSGVASGPSSMFAERKVTYAADSVIHYGDQRLDVAPYEVRAFVATDDGFVFVAGDDRVRFTDGTGIDSIGEVSGYGDQLVTAAATGSYAAWVDGDEAVVYDTAGGTEVLHAPVPGEGPGSAIAVDGNRAYVSNGNRVDVWDIDQQSKTSFTRPREYDEILAAANGYLAWNSGVVSRDPEATTPVFGRYAGMDETHLSPSGAYVAGAVWIYDRAEHENITPDLGRLRMEVIVQWLDNDRYVADTDNSLTSANPETHSLLLCSASARTCDVAVELTDTIVYPNGLSHEGA